MQRAIQHLQRAEEIIANKSNNFGATFEPSIEFPFNVQLIRIVMPGGRTGGAVNRSQYNKAVNTGAVENVIQNILRGLADNGSDQRENQDLVKFEWAHPALKTEQTRLIIGFSVNSPDQEDVYDEYMFADKMDEITKMKSLLENAEDDAAKLIGRIVQECLSGSNNKYLRNMRINSHQVQLYAILTGERVTRAELNAKLQNLHNAFYSIPPRRLFPWDVDYDYTWQRENG